MIQLIRYFILEWRTFPEFKIFCDSRELKWKGKNKEQQYRGRFDYALRNARMKYAHRDRYSKRCTGDCESCTLKHC